MMFTGLKAGIAYGLVQDAVGLMDGGRPEYLKYLGLLGAETETP